MDIEFHYYMTYLIAARAGFAPDQAAIIAQSAQEIDDNHIPIRVSAGTAFAYDSIISQTMDILHPRHNMKIYPIFHFIPGDPDAPSARRKDGLKNAWVTTPNSVLANEMLDTALASKDLYRIGASAHAFADTWAHQNFTGRSDGFNGMPPSSLEALIKSTVPRMKTGHAMAGHLPDIPGLVWTDPRLLEGKIDNTDRFVAAAEQLFRKLALYLNPKAVLDAEVQSLISDLREDIGPSTPLTAQLDPRRVLAYQRRALQSAYGAVPIPDYRVGQWADAAFIEQHGNPLRQSIVWIAEHAGLFGDVLDFGTRMTCTWRDPQTREHTDWYRFQMAVRAHLDECWGVLQKRMADQI